MNMPYLAFKQAFRNNQKEQKNIPCQLKNICYLPQQFVISEFQNLSSKNPIFVKYEHNLRIHCTFMQANKLLLFHFISMTHEYFTVHTPCILLLYTKYGQRCASLPYIPTSIMYIQM